MLAREPISVSAETRWLFWAFAGLSLLSFFAGAITNYYFLFGMPAALLVGYLCLVDFKKVYFLLWALIPISTEIYLPGGLGTDLPDEPFMLLLTGVFFLYLIRNGREMDKRFFVHPITLLLFLHLAWMTVAMITSSLPLVSVKFLLAKAWYVVSFYFMAGLLLKTEQDKKKWLWWIFIPLMLTVTYVFVRHASYGFSFKDVNRAMSPFYRNHVNYACLLALFFPLVWFARTWYKAFSFRWLLLVSGAGLLLVAIQFAYTRAAYVGLAIALGAYFIIRLRLTLPVLLLTIAGAIVGVGYMLHQEKYLEYAPDFEKTVTHYKFDNLLEATAKGEDISTMERVYRWVAGKHMIEDKPLVGFGPGNFYNFYRSYTVSSFETYVSDNPEKSGIHSYYLMTTVEQGLPGLLIFLTLSFSVLLLGQRVYHRTLDPFRKRWVMAITLSAIVIDALLLINDMVETDKVGSFFFFFMAMLVRMDLEDQA
ncbi:MAG: O-antigen ligase family protein [Saprospirales bacterium]|nr:O-antigen ligase family protein [Saprospirales bacterium]MBK8490050.1 O-antigen ligase family protein [Saprospirales bacterium]